MIKKIFSNELFRGSFILLFLVSIGNVLSYFFQFAMAWMLGPADYSILATITSIIAIFGIPTLSLQTIIAKHTTELNIHNDLGKIKGMFRSLTIKALFFSAISFLTFSIISYLWLSRYLDIPFSILLLTGTFIFGAFLYPIAAGILQGTKRFKALGFSFIINGIFKLIVGIGLVFIGWQVYGAVLGFIFGIMISFLMIFPFIKDILSTKASPDRFNLFSKKGHYAFLAIVILVLIYSLDVIFAKAFFSAEIAGRYSVISLLGKIILFLTMSIGSVMFPINSERFLKGGKTSGILKKTMFLVLLICGFSLLVFLLFPELVVNILFGAQYSSSAGILFYIGVAFSSISLLNILILNSISRNKFKLPQFSYLLGSLILFNWIIINIPPNNRAV